MDTNWPDQPARARILIVDDDPGSLDIVARLLRPRYDVFAARSGERALAIAMADPKPDLILLDVMMSGIDGYETCRRLKKNEASMAIPVIFVSACDAIEDRLKGYEVGGEDYVTKPFDAQELLAKVAHLLMYVAERASLRQTVDQASSVAMTAMTSMSELGSLLEAMKTFSTCTDYSCLADAILAGMALYGLQGVSQIRGLERTQTRNPKGEASPLEASIIGHMANMDRVVQFKSRISCNYAHISLLVTNMPTEDPERCGRLRDHLAMLAGGAEGRVETIDATSEAQRRGVTIEHAINRVTATLEDIDRAQRDNQVSSRLAVEELTQRIERVYAMAALSTDQEEYMEGIVQEGLDHLLNVQMDVSYLQKKLSSIVTELKAMSE